MGIKISVLDQSPIYSGETAEEAFAHTVELAQKSEQWGYKRFWVSEHHASDKLAGSSPEVLIAYLLAKTSSIRIGSGGVMLQHYSPYKVAENFNVLASLAPGRVDLGVGRAPGGLPKSTLALQRGSAELVDLNDKIVELQQYIQHQEETTSDQLVVTPLPRLAPELYVLGASVASAVNAAKSGLPYVFSLFINGDESQALEAITTYRNTFESNHGSLPHVIVAVSLIAADSEEEASLLAGSHKLVKIHLASGKTLTVSTIEQAEEFASQSDEPYTIEEKEAAIIKGTKENVYRKLLALQQEYGVDEFIINSNINPFSKRLRSFELLNEAINEALNEVPTGI